MTNHPNRSKKAWSTVRVSAKDARDLAMMLKLHATACNERASQISNAGAPLHPTEQKRWQEAIKSWDRASRKAKSFAGQFEEMALAAENGMAIGEQQLR